jgi:hypothetical protein
MLPAGFESVVAASERPQSHALDCAANGIGIISTALLLYFLPSLSTIDNFSTRTVFRDKLFQC